MSDSRPDWLKYKARIPKRRTRQQQIEDRKRDEERVQREIEKRRNLLNFEKAGK